MDINYLENSKYELRSLHNDILHHLRNIYNGLYSARTCLDNFDSEIGDILIEKLLEKEVKLNNIEELIDRYFNGVDDAIDDAITEIRKKELKEKNSR